MLRTSETKRCRAESRFIGIDFAIASHCSFHFNPLKRSLNFARDDKSPIFLSAHLSCWASRSIALLKPFNSCCFFGNRSLPNFSVAMQRFTLALWNAMACIALHARVPLGYKCWAPTGQEALFVVCGIDLTPSPSPYMRGKKQLGNFLHG